MEIIKILFQIISTTLVKLPHMTFGTFFKQKRMETKLTLRQFCSNKGLDPAFISRLENDIIPAPSKELLLKTLAKALNLRENTTDWVEFFDLASLSRGEVPEDIQQDFPKVLAYLPAFLRSVKKNKVTKKDVNDLKEQLIKIIVDLLKDQQSLKSQQEQVLRDFATWYDKVMGKPTEMMSAVETFLKELEGNKNV